MPRGQNFFHKSLTERGPLASFFHLQHAQPPSFFFEFRLFSRNSRCLMGKSVLSIESSMRSRTNSKRAKVASLTPSPENADVSKYGALQKRSGSWGRDTDCQHRYSTSSLVAKSVTNCQRKLSKKIKKTFFHSLLWLHVRKYCATLATAQISPLRYRCRLAVGRIAMRDNNDFSHAIYSIVFRLASLKSVAWLQTRV